MIEKDKFMPIHFFKKEPFSGSYLGMRYRVEKWEKEGNDEEKENVLRATVWPEPYCYEKTPEDEMLREEFPFTAEGVLLSVDWLNEQYTEKRKLWEAGWNG